MIASTLTPALPSRERGFLLLPLPHAGEGQGEGARARLITEL